MGYFFSINSGNGDAFEKIGKAIRAYITRNLTKPAIPAPAPLPPNAAEYAGWYVPDSSRVKMTTFIDRLAGLSWIHFDKGQLLVTGLGDWNDVFVPVSGAQFRHVPKKDLPDPIPTFALLTPNADGLFLQAGIGGVMKNVPAWFAVMKILATVFVVLSMLAIVIYAPFWILGGISKRRRRPAERSMRLWPLIAVLSLVTMVAIVIVSGEDLIQRMGNFTFWSAAIFVTTSLFALASVISIFAVWSSPWTEFALGSGDFH